MSTRRQPPPLPRDPTGNQQLRQLGKTLQLDPNELSRRVAKPRCVLCTTDLTYIRYYFERHQCCPACEAKLDAQTVSLLAKLGSYL